RLAWPMCGAKPLRSIPAIIRPPLRKIVRTNLQVLGDLCAALARHQPSYRRELDLPVENSPFCCGHPAFLETVVLVFVSHFRVALKSFILVGRISGLGDPLSEPLLVISKLPAKLRRWAVFEVLSGGGHAPLELGHRRDFTDGLSKTRRDFVGKTGG